MRNRIVWARLLGLKDAVVEDVVLDADGQIVAHVRPVARQALRCSRCLRSCRRYDRGPGRRRWRHLDAGTLMVHLEADAPR
ncbi:hypothetical protein ABH935_010279, partial [Catenulispora sp. GAS73]|uniref:transposase family protein n=1 Tax=Catenulispora sp. GAS73 TaxID=3156269 RepID=UPI0035189448